MAPLRSGCCFAFVLSLLAASGAGCGGSHGEGPGSGGASSSTGEGGGGAGPASGSGAGPVASCNADVDCEGLETAPCWVAICNTGQFPGPVDKCVYLPGDDGAACDDGQFCTVGDSCAEGACVGAPNTCGMTGANCEVVFCDEDTQACGTVTAANGTECVLDDLCVLDPKCDEGACIGPAKMCAPAPFGSCSTNSCNPASGECEESPDPGKDGDACTGDDPCLVLQTCSGGACTGGEPMDCSWASQGCLVGVCDPINGFCVGEPIPAGGACTPEDSACNTGSCDAGGTCQPVPVADGTACSDDNTCTQGETCSAGVCQGGVVTTPLEVYFSEDFSSNAAGWQMDTEWAIGAAVPSSPMSFAPDPEFDHSPSADNGIAAAGIGLDISVAVHPFWYLTSPAVDVGTVTGPLYVEFWRWLTSDFPPFMENTVDVWDGTQWVTVWASDGMEQTFDQAWVRKAYDLTPYKNPALRVRFGHAIGFDGGFPGWGGWNVDDVRLVNQSCD